MQLPQSPPFVPKLTLPCQNSVRFLDPTFNLLGRQGHEFSPSVQELSFCGMYQSVNITFLLMKQSRGKQSDDTEVSQK